MSAMTRCVRIGELAAEVGLNPKTIRYYEAIGLLPPPARSAAGYRLYGDEDQVRLRFIAKAKAVGFTLEEIHQILTLRRDGGRPCSHVLGLLEHRITEIDEQIRALAGLREVLATLRTSATGSPYEEAHICGIIERHEGKARADTGSQHDSATQTSRHSRARAKGSLTFQSPGRSTLPTRGQERGQDV